ncbi:hypothetical protein [Thermoflexus hugenholtzii]
MDLQGPLGQPKGKMALERVFEWIRRRWEEIPPSLRPLVGISAGIGGLGLVLFLAGLILLLRGAPSAAPTPTPAIAGAPVGPVPVRIRVKEVAFSVRPLPVQGGRWPVPAGGRDVAYWMEGTVVNPVFGLPGRPETRRLVEGLQEGDPIEVEMTTGPALRFQVAGKQPVQPTDVEILAQHRPGLTLLLTGGDPRWAVIAMPLAQTPVLWETAGRVPIGVPVQVGSVRLTVSSVEMRTEGPDIPAESVGVLVRFELDHSGEMPLSLEGAEILLIDASGRRYQPVPLGEVPRPAGQVRPGGTFSGVVAFLLPRGRATGVLAWRFNPMPGRLMPVEVEFELPRPTPTPPPEARLQIQIQSAQWSAEEGTLVIRGGVGNTGDQPVTLAAEEVELIGSEGQPIPLLNASPALPWTIPAGRTLGFELRFALADREAVMLRIGAARFQIR